MVMQRSFVSAFLLSVILGLAACSKEEPEGTDEKMGKKIDDAVESAQEQTSEAAEAAQKQAGQPKAEVGAAMEEMGEDTKDAGEKSSQ